MLRLDTNNLEKSLEEAKVFMHEHKVKVNEIIKPFLSNTTETKKRAELRQVANFILCFGGQLEIVDGLREAPDFILSQGDSLIGLEVRALCTKAVERNNRIQDLFDKAASEFELEDSGSTMHINFWLEDNFNYLRKEKANFIAQIVEFVRHVVVNSIAERPKFIKDFDIQPSSKISFQFNEGGYSSEVLEGEIVLDAIADKEAKLDKYVENSKTKSQWLLLVNSEVGSDSFDTYDFEGIAGLQTTFEHIYLLKNFDCQVVKLK